MFLCFWDVNAQTEEGLIKIDSIHNVLNGLSSKDSLSIAKHHYRLGEIYKQSLKSDSAYFYFQKAEKFFKKSGLKFETAVTLFGIAVIQANDKDYTGSEVTSFEAIALLEQMPQTNDVRKYTSYIYNCLGVVFDELGLFDQGIEYLEKSLSIKRTLKGDYSRSIGNSLNNLVKAYTGFGQYDLAKDTYKKIVSDKDLIENNPDVYVLAIGNYANALFLSRDFKQLPYLYHKALKITDSLDYQYNSIILYQHLAEFHQFINNSDSAKYYAYKVKAISEQYNNDDLLKSLLLLSKVETNSNATEHLRAYVKLSDSLQKNERAIRNKFARIRFETKKIQEENVQIAKERTWLLVISIILIVASVLLYLAISQRIKNNELQFIQKQQQANEEIYNLMLSQNQCIAEARSLEKKRISQELHDGVLGRLFGTRLSLDSLNMSNSDEAVAARRQYLSRLKTIEEDIRKVSHELNTDFVSGSGFLDIITSLVETQTHAYKIKYTLKQNNTISWDSISNKNKIHIYRIIQETLHNIHKHAKATEVNISFKLKNDLICFIIKDDGVGFEMDRLKSGIGLKNIKSRVKEINGTINISSKKNNGTEVKIEAPIA